MYYTRIVCQNVENVLLNMSVIFPQKYCGLCGILRFKVFGLVTSFGLRFLFYDTGFTAGDLRQTTFACYRLGHCYTLVDSVYKRKCEEMSLEISPHVKEWGLVFFWGGTTVNFKSNVFSTRKLRLF